MTLVGCPSGKAYATTLDEVLALRSEVERLRAALLWLEDYEPGLVGDAREKFLTQQKTP